MNNMVLKGTDLTDDSLVRGNMISILIEYEDEMKRCYQRLSESGLETYPVLDNFFGGKCGMITDRYGFQWLLRYNAK